MKNAGPVYWYDLEVTCDTCGEVSGYAIMSVNPYKLAMTFKQVNPITGLGPFPSMWRLPCGHEKDLEGYPVVPHKEPKP